VKKILKSIGIALLALLSAGVAHATTRTAASCAASDIQATVNASSDGDTVLVPSGASSASWGASAISVTKGITINGQGCNVTSTSTGNSAIAFTTDTTASAFLTGFNFTGINVVYFETLPNKNFPSSAVNKACRMYGNTFDDGTPASASTLIVIGGEGPCLIDHNTFTTHTAADEVIHNNGWENPSTFTGWTDDVVPGGPNMLFAENNTFTNTNSTITSAIENFYGARMVWRYNTMTNEAVDVHGVSPGTCSSPVNNGRWWEIYNNSGLSDAFLRGGSGVAWGNTGSSGHIFLFEDCAYPASGSYPLQYQMGRGINGTTSSPAYTWENSPTTCNTSPCGGSTGYVVICPTVTGCSHNPADVVDTPSTTPATITRCQSAADVTAGCPVSYAYTPYTYPHPLDTSGPVASISPASLSFGSVATGSSSSSQNVTLTNVGTASMTISNIQITGTNPGDFSDTTTCGAFPSSLGVEASCTVSVTFTPTTSGSRVATLTFSDNATGNTQNVALSGTGTGGTPSANFNPTALSFSNQIQGTSSASQQIKLCNGTWSGSTCTPSTAVLNISSVPALVQHNAKTLSETATTTYVSFASNNTTGCFIFAAADWNASAGVTVSVSDSENDTFVAGVPQTLGNGQNIQTWQAYNCAGGTNTVIFTYSGVNSRSGTGYIVEFSGVAAVSALDQVAAANGTGTAVSAGPLTTTSANELLVGFIWGDGASPTSGFTTIDTTNNNTVAYKTVSSAGSYSLTATQPSNIWDAALATFISAPPISITGSNPADFSETNNCPSALAAGSTCNINVTFTPVSAASFSANLSVSDNASGSPQTAGLSGTGITGSTPAVAFNPTSLDFNPQIDGTTSAGQTVTICNGTFSGSTCNASTATLTISGLSIGGPNASAFGETNTCGSTLAAGATCTATVTFSPTATSLYSATLQISDNATGTPQAISLMGIGYTQTPITGIALEDMNWVNNGVNVATSPTWCGSGGCTANGAGAPTGTRTNASATFGLPIPDATGIGCPGTQDLPQNEGSPFNLALQNPAGTIQYSAQFRCTAHWPSGNAKWVLIDAQLPSFMESCTNTIMCNGTLNGVSNGQQSGFDNSLVLVNQSYGGGNVTCGTNAAPGTCTPSTNMAVDNGTTITVSTGVATFTILKANFDFFHDVTGSGAHWVSSSNHGPNDGVVLVGPQHAIFALNTPDSISCAQAPIPWLYSGPTNCELYPAQTISNLTGSVITVPSTTGVFNGVYVVLTGGSVTPQVIKATSFTSTTITLASAPTGTAPTTASWSGEIYSSQNDPNSTCVIEENGGMHSGIKCSGALVNAEGDTYLDWTMRLHFYANHSDVKPVFALRHGRIPATCCVQQNETAADQKATAWVNYQSLDLRDTDNLGASRNFGFSNELSVTNGYTSGTMTGADNVFDFSGYSTDGQWTHEDSGIIDCVTGGSYDNCYVSPVPRITTGAPAAVNAYTYAINGHQIQKNGTVLEQNTGVNDAIHGWADIDDGSNGIEIGVPLFSMYFPKSVEFRAGSAGHTAYNEFRIGLKPDQNEYTAQSQGSGTITANTFTVFPAATNVNITAESCSSGTTTATLASAIAPIIGQSVNVVSSVPTGWNGKFTIGAGSTSTSIVFTETCPGASPTTLGKLNQNYSGGTFSYTAGSTPLSLGIAAIYNTQCSSSNCKYPITGAPASANYSTGTNAYALNGNIWNVVYCSVSGCASGTVGVIINNGSALFGNLVPASAVSAGNIGPSASTYSMGFGQYDIMEAYVNFHTGTLSVSNYAAANNALLYDQHYLLGRPTQQGYLNSINDSVSGFNEFFYGVPDSCQEDTWYSNLGQIPSSYIGQSINDVGYSGSSGLGTEFGGQYNGMKRFYFFQWIEAGGVDGTQKEGRYAYMEQWLSHGFNCSGGLTSTARSLGSVPARYGFAKNFYIMEMDRNIPRSDSNGAVPTFRYLCTSVAQCVNPISNIPSGSQNFMQYGDAWPVNLPAGSSWPFWNHGMSDRADNVNLGEHAVWWGGILYYETSGDEFMKEALNNWKDRFNNPFVEWNNIAANTTLNATGHPRIHAAVHIGRWFNGLSRFSIWLCSIGDPDSDCAWQKSDVATVTPGTSTNPNNDPLTGNPCGTPPCFSSSPMQGMLQNAGSLASSPFTIPEGTSGAWPRGLSPLADGVGSNCITVINPTTCPQGISITGFARSATGAETCSGSTPPCNNANFRAADTFQTAVWALGFYDVYLSMHDIMRHSPSHSDRWAFDVPGAANSCGPNTGLTYGSYCGASLSTTNYTLTVFDWDFLKADYGMYLQIKDQNGVLGAPVVGPGATASSSTISGLSGNTITVGTTSGLQAGYSVSMQCSAPSLTQTIPALGFTGTTITFAIAPVSGIFGSPCTGTSTASWGGNQIPNTGTAYNNATDFLNNLPGCTANGNCLAYGQCGNNVGCASLTKWITAGPFTNSVLDLTGEPSGGGVPGQFLLEGQLSRGAINVEASAYNLQSQEQFIFKDTPVPSSAGSFPSIGTTPSASYVVPVNSAPTLVRVPLTDITDGVHHGYCVTGAGGNNNCTWTWKAPNSISSLNGVTYMPFYWANGADAHGFPKTGTDNPANGSATISSYSCSSGCPTTLTLSNTTGLTPTTWITLYGGASEQQIEVSSIGSGTVTLQSAPIAGQTNAYWGGKVIRADIGYNGALTSCPGDNIEHFNYAGTASGCFQYDPAQNWPLHMTYSIPDCYPGESASLCNPNPPTPANCAAGNCSWTLNTASSVSGRTYTAALFAYEQPQNITLIPSIINFGNVTVGITSPAQVATLQNNGSTTLTISGAPALQGINSGDFSISSTTCGSTLAASASCTVSITFTPTIGGITSSFCGASGNENAQLVIVDNDPSSPQGVCLLGTGQETGSPTASVSPTSLSFGNQLIGTPSGTQTTTLTNTGTATLTVTSIVASGDFSFTTSPATVCGTTIAANASCTLTVTFTPTATGTRTGSIVITDNSSSGSTQTITLTGTGTAPSVTLNPTTLTYLVNVGQNATLTTTLQNTGTAALSITSLTLSDTTDYSQTNNCPVGSGTLAASGTCTISVTFTPSTTGTLNGTLSIVDSASGSPHVVNLAGTGVAPGGGVAVGAPRPH
jgi:Abnormal spindle-like microcephaly-assoc'd, ASPM-SPD-2-Hydin